MDMDIAMKEPRIAILDMTITLAVPFSYFNEMSITRATITIFAMKYLAAFICRQSTSINLILQ